MNGVCPDRIARGRAADHPDPGLGIEGNSVGFGRVGQSIAIGPNHIQLGSSLDKDADLAVAGGHRTGGVGTDVVPG